MYIGSIFLLLGILLLVILYLARPFLLHRATLVTKEEHDLSALLAEKERLIGAIQELDFDHALGKIPAEDYPIQRAALLAETAEVMQRLDDLREKQLTNNAPAHSPRQATQPRRPALVEASPDDELEALIANRRRERAEKAAGFCPQCGKPAQQSDRFCSKCGTPLLEEVEQGE
ncbi:MAG: hypothetical protein ANABAC_0083 [Anaerolineae bacterium]|nr:MAG: hypothetical protein ANABAC_0083 [Anaerolineae bacterium]